MEATKNINSTAPDVEDWDISFGIPLDELHEILNVAELAKKFADDTPRWDDNVSGTQQCIEVPEHYACAPSTSSPRFRTCKRRAF
ncbi:hypothetical protein NPIL_41211 [Nephila pilipes]|uniref:Uncharacterized protein n=1 Tax=Nephila pilipes TaxID=299642 RepID=A0A8X6QHY4_NEPPI|nr:hypothetical protein NPIL_41211 [Nephila pilipes]